MCEKHERLYKKAAEELQAFRSLEVQIRDNTADAETILKYMRTIRPPRARADLNSIKIQVDLTNRMAKSSPPFPVGCYFLWLAQMYPLFGRFPADLLSLESAEAAAALALEAERRKESSYLFQPEDINSMLAECYYEAGLYQKAVETLRKTEMVETQCPLSYYKALVEIGEFQEAYENFVKGFRIALPEQMDPESKWRFNPEHATYFARILEGLGRTEQAEKWRKCIPRWAEIELQEDPPEHRRLPRWLKTKMLGLLPEEEQVIRCRFGLNWPPWRWRECGGLSYQQVARMLAPAVNMGPDGAGEALSDEAVVDHLDGGAPGVKYVIRVEPDDIEYVRHVEEEALKQLELTYEELMSICHPGFIHGCSR